MRSCPLFFNLTLMEKHYVTLEQAKLLKEKGFTEKVHQYYQFVRDVSSKLNGTWQFIYSSFLVREHDAAMFPDEGKNGIEVSAYSDRIFRDYNFKTSEDFISAPEQHEVVLWLISKHNIWISVIPSYIKKGKWYYQRFHLLDPTKNSEPELVEKFDTPQQAYSAAFDYILYNNLI